MRQADALLALAVGRRQRAVHVDRRRLEERRRLIPPDSHADFVDRVLQRLDVRNREPPTETPGGRRIGNALRSQRIDITLVAPRARSASS